MYVCMYPLSPHNGITHEDIWASGGIAPPFFTSALDGGEWSGSGPGRFIPGEYPPVPI
jgi:hypothetical protein